MIVMKVEKIVLMFMEMTDGFLYIASEYWHFKDGTVKFQSNSYTHAFK